MTSIVVGCPIRGRSWMVEPWVAYLSAALAECDLTPSFAFVLDDGDHIRSTIREVCDARGIPFKVAYHPPYEGLHSNKEHYWNADKLTYMVGVRNALLHLVRGIAPSYFLSLDSDILIQRNVVKNLLGTANQFGYDAVGGKVYLTQRGKSCPSYGMINSHSKNIMRPDIESVCPVDILMAIKLMTPSAYWIDYEYHRLGEDLGWSVNVKKNGLKLGYDGRVASKHIMTQSMLESVDQRVGY